MAKVKQLNTNLKNQTHEKEKKGDNSHKNKLCFMAKRGYLHKKKNQGAIQTLLCI